MRVQSTRIFKLLKKFENTHSVAKRLFRHAEGRIVYPPLRTEASDAPSPTAHTVGARMARPEPGAIYTGPVVDVLGTGACRRIEKFCDRFSLLSQGQTGLKVYKIQPYLGKMDAPKQTQAVCLRLCGKLFSFLEATKSFSWTRGSGACLVPASSTAFSGQRPMPAGTAPCGCCPCPVSETGGTQSRF